MERVVGPADPELSIVVCLHGDETGPKDGVMDLYESSLQDCPVQVIVGNPEAIATGTRSIDEDLNRCFPGTPDGETHEQRRAAEIYDIVEGTTVLDLHTTTSTAEPFLVLGRITPTVKRLARASGLARAVDQSHYASGGLVQHVEGISIECGLQGSDDAARNARALTRRILQREGYLDGEPSAERSDPTVYQVYDEIERPDGGDVEIVADNFVRVDAGEPLYRRNGEVVSATDPCWPVLLSADDYSDYLGFAATKRGPISAY